ncbi:transcriptional regulator [Metallosphaera tengchongensis]|uniref:Transcriptional regulator n=1 Tax=Metallosphaera tengchongensis TaxID=1532350 RepID=A0A6N0NVT2_9CREN|nr:thiamine-phosphate synthase family protein [Metallosphaera tengchongensis]QKQ99758.1 transcriptional regulator [Metallosphaera tengchongensis]
MLDTPLSLITDILLPNVRGLVAKRLRAQGMSQNKISYLVGVTQPAVKQYLDEDEEQYIDKIVELGLKKDEIDSLVSTLVSLVLNGRGEEVSLYITTLGLLLLSELRFCNFHRSLNSSIPLDCKICQGLYKEEEESELGLAITVLKSKEVSKLIPEVLSNIAFSKKDPKDVLDVIAVPGRITVIGDLPTPASKPMWGGSKHLATVLLKIKDRCKKWRSVMNVKYDDKIENILINEGFTYKKVGPSDRRDDDAIAQMIAKEMGDCPEVVVHLGGNGLEPNAYVFGQNPLEVATKVTRIARLYSS